MEKYVECQNCKEQYDCERTYLGGCTDGEEWAEKPLLSKSDKEFYFALMTNCKKVIEKCPNIEERRIACEYCRFEQVRKKAVEEYKQNLEDGELVSKDWHDEQVLHAKNEIEELKKDYIELDLECRNLRTELDKELAEHEEFTKKAKAEIEHLDGCAKQFLADYQKCEIANVELQELNAKYYNEAKDLRRENAELQKQVNELKKKLDKEYERGYYFGKQDALTSDRSDNATSESDTSVYEQAVKDTAKEIFEWLQEHLAPTPNGLCILRTYLKERYGVEVE